jgi:hypothetical protein
MRPGSILDDMFYNADPTAHQIRILNKLYRKGNFGGAETYALIHVIYPKWIETLNCFHGITPSGGSEA